MQTTTQTQSQTRTLEIDGMTGDACVKKVTGALKEVSGVETQSVKVGSATIKCDKTACDAACAGIKAAGYTVREGTRTGHDSSENRNENRNESKGNSQGNPQGQQQNKAQPPAMPNQSNEAGKGGKADLEPLEVVTPGAAAKPALK